MKKIFGKMTIDKKIKIDDNTLSFWNNCHITKNIGGLSGCEYDYTIDFLKLRKFIYPNIKVLEIGVGIGHVSKELHDNGISVSALDVSIVALECVKDYCEMIFTVDEIEEIPNDYFDVIICLNVVQHVYTSLLIEEFKNCIRSLKKDGVFAIEFVSSDNEIDYGLNKNSNCGETFCRPKEYLKKMIEDLGGKVEEVYYSGPIDFGVVKGCYVFHIKK